MSYRRLIIGDANVVRSWQAAQLARPQFASIPLKTVSCMDTLSSSLEDISNELDYVVVSVMTGLVIEEGSASDVRGSSFSIIDGVVKRVVNVAKRTSRVQVMLIFY